MEELSQEELIQCSGGYLGRVLTYMTLVDLAYDFGRGLGNGLYDGANEPEIP
ncbi:MAG: hypothetical protein VX781_01270 [Pseudomonadota bacterium]|nr:hypothetical protein [Pseudomonadota bacterium]